MQYIRIRIPLEMERPLQLFSLGFQIAERAMSIFPQKTSEEVTATATSAKV